MVRAHVTKKSNHGELNYEHIPRNLGLIYLKDFPAMGTTTDFILINV